MRTHPTTFPWIFCRRCVCLSCARAKWHLFAFARSKLNALFSSFRIRLHVLLSEIILECLRFCRYEKPKFFIFSHRSTNEQSEEFSIDKRTNAEIVALERFKEKLWQKAFCDWLIFYASIDFCSVRARVVRIFTHRFGLREREQK